MNKDTVAIRVSRNVLGMAAVGIVSATLLELQTKASEGIYNGVLSELLTLITVVRVSFQ